MSDMTLTAATTPARSAAGRPILDAADADLFRERLHRRSFPFHHTLNDSHLFTVPRLAKLAQTMLDSGNAEGFVAYDASAFGAGSGFGIGSRLDQVAETVRRLEQGRTWLKLSKSNAVDPAYAEVLAQVIRDIERLSGEPFGAEITWGSLTVIMASPRITTPYHIDHETNFLFQAQGEKDVCLFDPGDRQVLTDGEVESFYMGHNDAATYKPDLQSRGTIYRLVPGLAVHHPPLAPHWVKNSDNVSVSISMTFCTRSVDRNAKVYQANRVLRRLGLNPKRPDCRACATGLKARRLNGRRNRMPHRSATSSIRASTACARRRGWPAD